MHCLVVFVTLASDGAELKTWKRMSKGQGCCCRLEIGLQSIYEDVARDTNRGHTVAAVGGCFRLAKDAGFKARHPGPSSCICSCTFMLRSNVRVGLTVAESSLPWEWSMYAATAC